MKFEQGKSLAAAGRFFCNCTSLQIKTVCIQNVLSQNFFHYLPSILRLTGVLAAIVSDVLIVLNGAICCFTEPNDGEYEAVWLHL